jgi:hypothetical protein
MMKSKDKSGGAMAVARHALQLAQQAVKEPERKFYQFSSQTTNYLTGVSTACCLVSQGASGAQRVGDSLRAKRLRVRGKFYSLTPSDTTFRVALVRVIGAGNPSSTDVWTTDDTQSQRNRSLDDIYKVLKEETITLNASFLNGDLTGQLSWDVNLGDMPIYFTSGAATYERNGLHLVITNDVADAASSIDKPAIGDTGSIWRTELEFVDM